MIFIYNERLGHERSKLPLKLKGWEGKAGESRLFRASINRFLNPRKRLPFLLFLVSTSPLYFRTALSEPLFSTPVRAKKMQKLQQKSSFKDSFKALEADILHANALAASIPGDFYGANIQIRLSYAPLAPIVLFIIEWLDVSFSSWLGLLHILIYKLYGDGKAIMYTEQRKASLREFYAVIYPSLQQLEGNCMELEDSKHRLQCKGESMPQRMEENKFYGLDSEWDEECEICLELCNKVVLPNCGHALCIKCFRDWNTQSKSCPFCRDSLKRVNSRDLWILTGVSEVLEPPMLIMENLRQFYVYIEKLLLVMPESLFFVYDSTM